MKRKFVPGDELLGLLNERLHELLTVHTGGLFGPADCEFKGSIVPLETTGEAVNWTPPPLAGSGPALDSESCRLAATRAVQDVAEGYNLDQRRRFRDDWW